MDTSPLLVESRSMDYPPTWSTSLVTSSADSWPRASVTSELAYRELARTAGHHVDRWITEQTEAAQSKTGKPAAASTVARRMSCLSGLYEYAVVDAGLIEASPVVRVKRPKVSDHSST